MYKKIGLFIIVLFVFMLDVDAAEICQCPTLKNCSEDSTYVNYEKEFFSDQYLNGEIKKNLDGCKIDYFCNESEVKTYCNSYNNTTFVNAAGQSVCRFNYDQYRAVNTKLYNSYVFKYIANTSILKQGSDLLCCDISSFESKCIGLLASKCSEVMQKCDKDQDKNNFNFEGLYAEIDKSIDEKNELCSDKNKFQNFCYSSEYRTIGSYNVYYNYCLDKNDGICKYGLSDNEKSYIQRQCTDHFSSKCSTILAKDDNCKELTSGKYNDKLVEFVKKYDYGDDCDNIYPFNYAPTICNEFIKMHLSDSFKEKCGKDKAYSICTNYVISGDVTSAVVSECRSQQSVSMSQYLSSLLKENVSLSDFIAADTLDCTDISAITDLVNNIFGTIRIFAVVGTILLSSLDFMKPIIADDGDVDKKIEKAKKNLGTRLIVILILFLLPIIITVIFNNMSGIFGNVCR